MTDDHDRLARALLTRLVEPGDAAVAGRVAAVGAVAVVDELRSGRSPLRRADDYRTRLTTADPAADLGRLAELGGHFLVPTDVGWPRQLDDLGRRAPLGLWCRGAVDLRVASLRSVGVVGSRAATRYGDRVASLLGSGLGERGWTVVSGGAYGIDAAAHRGALAAGGPTVAVVAGGLDVTYPRGNEALFARIVESGLVVAEVPPGCAPTRLRFLVRNRLIAALTRGTVVVEAAARSGALSTASHAARLRRVVMGVPGPVTSATSEGVHGLLRGEALLVTGADDVVATVGPLGVSAAPAAGPDPAASLDPDDRRVLEALPVRAGVATERVAVTAGLAPLRVIAALGRLELTGLAERRVDGWRRAAAGP